MTETDGRDAAAAGRHRVLHKVLRQGGLFESSLNQACHEAEREGMVLLDVVDVREGPRVAVFAGAESLLGEAP